MARRPWNSILEHIRSLATRHDSPASDAELLRQFIAHHDEAAFEALLRRHGPMVLRVARRVVGNESDAEDVFQAAFLLLARRAGSIRKRESVASWLHGVAHRLALSARGKRVRRQMREREAAAVRAIESPPESVWSELEGTLHEVLAQLPARYRTPLVYCYLEGLTQEEVARQLGKPIGTVRSWLARGRDLLRKRLVRRGIALSTEGASAALLASACATAEAVPPPLRVTTLQAAHLFATGGNAMTLVSPAVADLVRKGMTMMLVAKIKSGAAWVLMVSLLLAGSGWAAHRTFNAKPPEANEAVEKAASKQALAEERARTDAFGDPLPPGAVARLGTVRFRHEEWRQWQFAVSPDGRTLATAGGRSLILWDMATGRQKRRFPFGQTIRCLAFAPDGKSVVIGGEDCIVHRIDLATGKELQCFAGHESGSDPFSTIKGVDGVALSSDGKKLVSWGSDKTVRVWDAQSSKELLRLGDKDFGGKEWFVNGLSPDGKLLALSKVEGLQTPLHLWDLETGKEVPQRSYPIAAAAFSPDGKSLAIAETHRNRPTRIVLLDVESGKELRTARNELKFGARVLAFSPDGKTLAGVGFGLVQPGSRVLYPCIHLWDVESMKELRAGPPSADAFSAITQLVFSPDGKTLITRSDENHVRLWDVATAKERIIAKGQHQAVLYLAYSPDAKLLASACRDRIWLWSATTGKVTRILEIPQGRGEFISALGFSANGKALVSADSQGAVHIWNAQTGMKQHGNPSVGTQILGVALAPDGETVAAWSLTNQQTLSLWNTRTEKKVRDISIPARGDLGGFLFLRQLLFSSDGKTLYGGSGSHRSILRWDAATGKELSSIGKHPSGIDGMALSQDERSLAVINGGGSTMTPKGEEKWEGELHLWEVAAGQKRFAVKDAGFATTVAFSPDGNLLALVNAGNNRFLDPAKKTTVIPGAENMEQVRIVRVADGKVIHRFAGHLGSINCVRFSPDGRTLASGGNDSTVLIWDVTDRTVPRTKESPSLTPEKLGELWKVLLGTAEEAHVSMAKMIAAPRQTVSFLGEKLKPVVTVDAERIARLLKKLDSDQFAEREEATRELKKLGDTIEPALRKALHDKIPLETRKRLQALLDELDGSERLRSLRAVEVLERIGDKSSRDLLRRLSAGAAGAWLTEESRMTLQRLEQRER